MKQLNIWITGCLLALVFTTNLNAQDYGVEVVHMTPLILLEETEFTSSLDLEKEGANWGLEVVYYNRNVDLTPYISFKRGFFLGWRSMHYSQQDFTGVRFDENSNEGDLFVIQEIQRLELGYTAGLRFQISKKIRIGGDLIFATPFMVSKDRLLYAKKEFLDDEGITQVGTFHNNTESFIRDDEGRVVTHASEFLEMFRFGISIDYDLGPVSLVAKLDYRYQDIEMDTDSGLTKDKFEFRSYYLTPKIGIYYDLSRRP